MNQDNKSDYDKMLKVYVGCVDSLRGRVISNVHSWQADVEPIAIKLFFHLGSIGSLQEGTPMIKITGVPSHYIDFPSIATIARAALETYLSFHYIYISPEHESNKRFKHAMWRLGGFKDRQKFIVTTQNGINKLRQEIDVIKELESIISNHDDFKLMSEKMKRKALKGEWRLNNSWGDLASNTGLHRNWFETIYKYTSNHAHTGYIGILQIAQAQGVDVQQQLANIYTTIGLIVASHFMKDYASIFEEVNSYLEGNIEGKRLIQQYFIKAEDMDSYYYPKA